MRKIVRRALPLLAMLVVLMMPMTVSARTASATITSATISGVSYKTSVKIYLNNIPADGTNARASEATKRPSGFLSISSTGYSDYLRVKFTTQNGAEVDKVIATVTKSGVATTVEVPYLEEQNGYSVYRVKIDGTVTQIDINLNHVCKHDSTQIPYTKTEATCTTPGTTTKTCIYCNGTTTEVTKEATGHAFTLSTAEDKYLKSAATCTEDAVYYKSCCFCGEAGTETFTQTGTATGHNWSEYAVTKKATCTTPGEKTSTCANCDEIRTQEIPAIGHNWDDGVVTKEATEDEKGIMTFTCRNCNASYTVDIPEKEHVHAYTLNVVDEKYLAQSATCTSAALYYKSCNCGAVGTETFSSGNPIPHSFTNYVNDNNATCTKDGTKTATCDACGTATDTVTIEGSAKGHTWDEGKVTTAPTVDCEGVKTFTCLDCQETKTETIPKLEPENPNPTTPEDPSKDDPKKPNPTIPEDPKKPSDGDKKTTTEDTTVAKTTVKQTKVEKTEAAKPKTPKTGDESSLMLWAMLILISGGSVVGAGAIKHRR